MQAESAEATSQEPSLTELVTFAIANFNGESELPPTLDALLALAPGCRVLVVDDGSTDDSKKLVRERFPDVELIEFEHNIGLAGVRKRAVEECKTPFLMLMDNDVKFAPDCVPRLLEQLQQFPNALSCRPRLVYADRHDIIYQDASVLHYLALSANQLRGEPVSKGLTPVPRQTIGGGIMLLNCAIARELGNFDENYMFGWSDGELDVRARLLGYLTLQDPYAIGYHIERPGGLRRVVGQLYNRRRLILISYSTRALVLFAPALLFFELLILGMCLASGYAQQYMEAWRRLIAHSDDIRRRRRELHSRINILGDKAFLTGGQISITGRMASSRWLLWLSPTLSAAFSLYWKLVGPLVPGKGDPLQS